MAPQARGIPDGEDVRRIRAARELVAAAQLELEQAVADALISGGSVREVAAASGLSATTVQKYGRAHGWPTTRQRQAWDERRQQIAAFRDMIADAESRLRDVGKA